MASRIVHDIACILILPSPPLALVMVAPESNAPCAAGDHCTPGPTTAHQFAVDKLEGTISTSTIIRGSEEWNLIADRECYDMMLYYYASYR